MKLSLFSPPASFSSYRQVIDFCVQNHIEGLELFPMLELAEYDVQAARQVAQEAREKGLTLTCCSIGVDLGRAENGVQMEKLKRWVDCTAAAGAPFIHHTLALSLTKDYGPVTFRQMLDRLIPAARAIFDYAADHGVLCLYEDQGMYINGTASFSAFLDALDRPAGVCLDVGNCLFVDEPPEKFAGAFLPLVRHVHLKDYIVRPPWMPNPGEGWYRSAAGNYMLEVTMGHGSVNFETVFEQLVRGGYDGWYSLEFFGAGDVAEQVQSVKNVRRYYQNACARAAVSGTADLLSAE